MNTHFMMNLFNKEKQSTKNSETSRPIPKSASVSKEAPSEFVTINIYENPSIQSIKSNISIKQSKMFLNYYDIGFMASITENLLILSPPIKDLLHYNEKAAKAKHESDSVVFQDNFQKNIKASKKLDKKVNARQQLFDNIYKVYPDFCHNMEEKVGSSKYNLYLREKTKLKRLLLQGKNYSGNELYSQALLNYQDNVSTVIDTPEFSEACSVEDQFLISELDTFFKILSELPKEEQKKFHRKKIKIGNEAFSTFELAGKVKEDRLTRLDKYSEIKKLYKKLDRHPFIKIENCKKSSKSEKDFNR